MLLARHGRARRELAQEVRARARRTRDAGTRRRPLAPLGKQPQTHLADGHAGLGDHHGLGQQEGEDLLVLLGEQGAAGRIRLSQGPAQ